ncbi:MAG: NAD(P)-dependent oxidoreductase [bacterium]
MTFRVGLTRELRDAQGEPAFGRRALAVLDENPAIEWEYIPEALGEITPEVAARYDGIYVNAPKVTRASVARGDCRVKIFARHGVGYEAVEVPAITQRGNVVTNTPRAVRRPVAVAALTMLFALPGRLFAKDRLTRAGRWAERTSHMGVGLVGRTLGLVGAGGIGQELLRVAQPFGMRHLVADPYVGDEVLGPLGAQRLPLDALMRESDFVVVTCLLNAETHHLIGARQLALMKPTAFFISMARGAVVDEPALTEVLEARRIAGAGIDVFEQEPVDPANPLLKLDNVIVTPHALCWTDECFHDIASTGLKSIVDISLGRRPAHLVDPQAWKGGA